MAGPDHDPSCDVAHGKAAVPGEQRALVAVFASPVAGFLLRYAADAGYRAVLVEPDPELAKAADGEFAEVTASLTGVAGLVADGTDVVVTDHHRPELGPQLRDALAADVRWVGIMGSPRVPEPPHITALAELGVPAEQVSRVHRPIGLNIGSRAPAEIAIATLAGLIADRNGRPGGFEF